jgi:hypothetical protein
MNRLGYTASTALLSLALVTGACGSDETAGSGTPAPTSAPAGSTTVAPQTTRATPQGETVSGERIRAVVPPGWDVRVGRTDSDGSGASSKALVHAANFPLVGTRGTLGGEAVARLGSQHVFVALVEAGQESAGRPLYAASGLPRKLEPQAFSPDAMERPVPGQAGLQRFFTDQGRPFTLYVVLGSYTERESLVPLVNTFLAGVTIEPTR